MQRDPLARRVAAAPTALCCAACLSFFAATAARGDTIINGGFETGNFTGWAPSGTSDSVTSGAVFGWPGSGPHSGTYWAELVSHFGDIEQTASVTPGQAYLFSFFMSSDDASNKFRADFGSALALYSTASVGVQGWTQYSFVVTPTVANPIIRFFFDARNDPINPSAFHHLGLDDVSVTEASSAAPLPGAAGAGMALFIALGGIKLRRPRRVTA